MKNIIVFEDGKFDQFLPLTYLRPVYDLKCGAFSLYEKIFNSFKNFDCYKTCRNELLFFDETEKTLSSKNLSITEGLLINGRVLDLEISDKIEYTSDERAWFCDDTLVALKFNSSNVLSKIFESNGLLKNNALENLNIKTEEIKTQLVEYPWDLIYSNGSEIKNDSKYFLNKNLESKFSRKYPSVNLVNEQDIYTGNNVVIKPGVVLDASEGPIIIDNNVTIFPNSVIIGPVYIGNGSKIKSSAKIYENTTIGEVCKIGGEVENSIFQSYSNKQHDGFVGHSYIGSWVNLGADTNNSDLKNNYSNIKVTINNKTIDTGKNILGLIMGDHSKTAINTMFNTGTVVGIFSNIFGAGFPPKVIDSFAWGGYDKNSIYDVEKALKTAKIVMKRRDKDVSNQLEEMIRSIYNSLISS